MSGLQNTEISKKTKPNKKRKAIKMEMLKTTGKVHIVEKTQSWSSGFAKRNLVIDISGENDKFKNYAVFEFVKSKQKDRTTLLDKVNVGDKVEVSFYLDAREYKGNWYASNKAMSIKMIEAAIVTEPELPLLTDTGDDPDIDDMPF